MLLKVKKSPLKIELKVQFYHQGQSSTVASQYFYSL